MSNFYDIQRTFAKVLDDSALLTLPIIHENQDFDPTSDAALQWAELSMIPTTNISGNKSVFVDTGGYDENEGIAQISLFDKETGGGSRALLDIADIIGSIFLHGVEFIEYNDLAVFIQQTDRNQGRIEGGYYQIDLSVSWTSYVGRFAIGGFGFANGFSEGFEQ